MQEGEQFKEVRLSYQLIWQQQDAFNALVKAADDITGRMEAAGLPGSWESQERPKCQQKDPALERIDQLCLELCMTLLNHELGDDEYESVIISGLAVLGFGMMKSG